MEVLFNDARSGTLISATSPSVAEYLILFGGIYRIAVYDHLQRVFRVKNSERIYFSAEELDGEPKEIRRAAPVVQKKQIKSNSSEIIS